MRASLCSAVTPALRSPSLGGLKPNFFQVFMTSVLIDDVYLKRGSRMLMAVMAQNYLAMIMQQPCQSPRDDESLLFVVRWKILRRAMQKTLGDVLYIAVLA